MSMDGGAVLLEAILERLDWAVGTRLEVTEKAWGSDADDGGVRGNAGGESVRMRRSIK